MQTSLYKISFKDGRVYNVYCANRKQNKDMLHYLFEHQKEIKRNGQVVMACDIHDMLQFTQIMTPLV